MKNETIETGQEAPEKGQQPIDGKELAETDIQGLDKEIAALKAEYSALLAEKQEEAARLKAKIAAIKQSPDELLGKRPIAAVYTPEKLMAYPSQELKKVISAHLEKQLEGTKQDLWPAASWERKKNEYIQLMVDYVLAVKQGPNRNAIGVSAHPAGRYGTQIRSLAEILGISPITDILYP